MTLPITMVGNTPPQTPRGDGGFNPNQPRPFGGSMNQINPFDFSIIVGRPNPISDKAHKRLPKLIGDNVISTLENLEKFWKLMIELGVVHKYVFMRLYFASLDWCPWLV